MIPQETRPCELGIERETLSALRDDALSAEEAARLNQHIQSCAACRAALADFDLVAGAVRRQRELDPGNRVWNGVRMRLDHRARRKFRIPVPSRVFRGLGGVAAAAAVVLLFVYVLKANALQGKVGSGVIGTPVPASTVPSIPGTTSTIPPTPGPDTSSIYYHFRKAVTASLGTQLDATHNFVPQNITPDGQFLLGYELDSSAQSNPAIARAGYLNIRTRQFTALGMPDSTVPPDCCQADGNYLLANSTSPDSSQAGIWAYDWQTHQVRKLVASGQYHGISTAFLSQNRVIFNSGAGIEVADIASGAVHPLDASLSPDARALAFTWPYVVYSSPSSSGVLSYYALDLASGSAPHSLSQLPASAADQVNLYLSGTTLYMTRVQNETIHLYTLPSFMSTSSKLVELGSTSVQPTLPSGPGYKPPLKINEPWVNAPWANGKTVVVAASVWVAAAHTFYPAVSSGEMIDLSNAVVSGDYLATFVTLSSHTNTYVGSYVTVYNTALLP